MDVGLDGLLDLVEDVPNFVRPTPLDEDAMVDHRQGGQQVLAAIDADHLQALAGEPAAVQRGEEALLFGGALAA